MAHTEYSCTICGDITEDQEPEERTAIVSGHNVHLLNGRQIRLLDAGMTLLQAETITVWKCPDCDTFVDNEDEVYLVGGVRYLCDDCDSGFPTEDEANSCCDTSTRNPARIRCLNGHTDCDVALRLQAEAAMGDKPAIAPERDTVLNPIFE